MDEHELMEALTDTVGSALEHLRAGRALEAVAELELAAAAALWGDEPVRH
jgi:hypothetical protein